VTTKIIAAKYLLDSIRPIQVNKAVVLNSENEIIAIDDLANYDANSIQILDGILVPGFINTHCHLELSHLKNEIETGLGLPTFIQSLMSKRNIKTADEIQLSMAQADTEMYENGIVAVGDISNGLLSFLTKKNSKLFYHTFIELYGSNPQMATDSFAQGHKLYNELANFSLVGSLSPHAPYSLSAEAMKLIANFNHQNKFISCIHHQECSAENEYFINKTGDFIALFNALKFDTNYFKATGLRTTASIINYIQSNYPFLFVHNTFMNDEDIETIKNKFNQPYFCACPRANWFIEKCLPNIKLWQNNNLKITIGTDSLASNHSLSIWDEILFMHFNSPLITIQNYIEWACINGAQYMGIANWAGSIEVGKKPGINLLLNATPQNFANAVLKKIV
jgi:cytosine/adenosine deaminase-related metal-dependent hydrolase